MRSTLFFISALLIVSALSCNGAADPGGKDGASQKGAAMSSMQIKSDDFAHMGEIPSRHTCQGPDVSPELSFVNVPKDAKSLALIVDDPDAPDPKAPKMTWVHWLL